MRIEQKENNIYTKQPDRIDSYLIRIIHRFFDSEMKNIENTRESIITEAVNRMKKDLINERRALEEERKALSDKKDKPKI